MHIKENFLIYLRQEKNNTTQNKKRLRIAFNTVMCKGNEKVLKLNIPHKFLYK